MLYLYQSFIFLLGHLHFFLYFFFTFTENLFKKHPLPSLISLFLLIFRVVYHSNRSASIAYSLFQKNLPSLWLCNSQKTYEKSQRQTTQHCFASCALALHFSSENKLEVLTWNVTIVLIRSSHV